MAVLFAPLAAFAAAVAIRPAALQTTLCTMAEMPQAFSGKEVRFRAGVLTDWHHGIVLVHSGCQRGIELTSTNAAPRVQAKALDEAVGTLLDGGPHRTAMATFTGRFTFRTVAGPAGFDNPLKFDADRIQNIQIIRGKRPR